MGNLVFLGNSDVARMGPLEYPPGDPFLVEIFRMRGDEDVAVLEFPGVKPGLILGKAEPS